MSKQHKDFDWKKVQDKVEKVLGDEFFSEMNKFVPKRGPSIDVYETESSIMVVAEIPGLPSESDHVNIYVEGYKLFLDGNIPCTYNSNHSFHQSERFFGHFKREISLPFNVIVEGIEAAYRKGLLHVRIPKKDDQQNTKIPVQFHDSE